MIEHGFLPRRKKNGRKKLIKMIKILFTIQPRGLLTQVCNELMRNSFTFLSLQVSLKYFKFKTVNVYIRYKKQAIKKKCLIDKIKVHLYMYYAGWYYVHQKRNKTGPQKYI